MGSVERDAGPARGLALLAESRRGGHLDNVFLGVAAVVTPEGRLVAAAGDSGRRAFLRSAAKPIQLLPLLAAGGIERFRLTDAEIAVMCASHTGRPEHTEIVSGLLAKGGFEPGDLACGCHAPMAPALDDVEWESTPLTNNCSGNHVGQLLACSLEEYPTESYLEAEHPLQRQSLELLARLAGVEADDVEVGVDGCGLPAYRLPVVAAARLYAALADPAAAGVEPDYRAWLERIAAAIAAHPRLVAGPGRFTTDLIDATGGRVLGKEGAKGFYAAAVRGPVALGVALKIADGSEACRGGVVLEILRQSGCLSAEELSGLEEHYRVPIASHAGLEVGVLEPAVELIDLVGLVEPDSPARAQPATRLDAAP